MQRSETSEALRLADELLDGMTMRDYFAAKAMQGFASTLTGTAPVLFEALAQDAYKMADAMLSATGTEKARNT